MDYIIFDTEQQAMDYSHAEAVLRGLGGAKHICQYWWSIRETVDGKWAVECFEGTETPEFEETIL